MRLSRHFAKLCDLCDFGDPELARLIPEIDPALSAERPHRKGWEYALTALFLRDVGLLDGDAEILDVGAGTSALLFWLARRCRRVVAVDLYGRGAFAEREAQRSMVEDPAAHAAYEYPRDRLEVREMDARSLDFPDRSFDAVVSLSAIEHFGSKRDIERSAAEIGRVLRPGGYAFIVTEIFLRRSWFHRPLPATLVRMATAGRRARTARPGIAFIHGFTPREVHRLVIAASGLELLQPLDVCVSRETRATVQTLPEGADAAVFPHVVLEAAGTSWTSGALPLVKPRAHDGTTRASRARSVPR